MSEGKQRLIEVNFPLSEVSNLSGSERGRSGHISTLHIWWARRPLAASRATALAALLRDDATKRDDYLQLIREISPWQVVSKDTPQNRRLLDRARKLVLEANGGKAPRVIDCFAGGGAIPLEALRLGCETYAVDYNPVAVLINRAVSEYPQRFGQPRTVRVAPSGHLQMEGERTVSPLVEELEKWGDWVFQGCRKELEPFYLRDKDGSIPLGYIWARTVPCQNPECGAEIPVMRQTWLARDGANRVALRILADGQRRRIEFEIAKDKEIDFTPEEGTVSQAHVRCPVCSNTIGDDDNRRLFSEGKSGFRLVAVVLQPADGNGKSFRLPNELDHDRFNAAQSALEQKRQNLLGEWGLDPVPNEPISGERPSPNARGLSAVTRYEMNYWSDLFNSRQKLALVTFTSKIREAHAEMLAQGLAPDLATAVTTYLAFAVDKLASHLSILTRWRSDALSFERAFDRQALPMIWDFGELNPLADVRGCWDVEFLVACITHFAAASSHPATVIQGTATSLPWPDSSFDAVLTDPPYYDNVPYSDLSDFFYVWLKRAVGNLYPDLFATPLTPKSEEIVWHQRHGGSYEAGKQFFEREILRAFREIRRILKPDGIAVIVFAHKTTEAWEAILNALMAAGIYMTGSWPIHTEMETKVNAQGTASLMSSIYMVCRKRTSKDIGEFPKIKLDIEHRVRQKLEKFWSEGIRGADFFMSAIGPAVEVFGRYERVEKLSGEIVTVAELLDYVETVVSEFALERILGSAELTGIDPETRFYLLWRWTYNSSRVAFDEARKLATAVGAEITSLWHDGQFVRKENEFIRALGPIEREKDKKFMDQVGFNTMVDALHRACIYWERGERKQLKEHLAQTYGASNMFWRIAQNIADVLPEGDKEKQLLQGLLNVPEARDKVQAGTGKLFS